jgi:hypothetical protein
MVPQFTPAGRLFITFLGTFNSGAREAIHDFIDEHYSPDALRTLSAAARTEQHLVLFKITGRLSVQKIRQPSPFEILVTAESKQSGKTVSVSMRVEDESPHYIIDFTMREQE